MAECSGLPWTRILSAEDSGHYKPDAEVYLGAARELNCEPHQLLSGAAYNMDLRGAVKCGLKTAFWPRPTEYGPRQRPDDLKAAGPWEIKVNTIIELADVVT
jgi:2-haloacid dehalogenase